MGGKASLSCLIKTEGIQKHIHLYQDERAYGCSFRQIRRPVFRDIRSVGENKGNQGDTDISRIGKHGAVFKSVPMTPSIAMRTREIMKTWKREKSIFAT